MKRRSFLRASSIISLPIALGGIPISSMAKSSLFNGYNGADNDRVLVLINLGGGNDGLNTLIPIDQYENLVKARGNIIIPSDKLLTIGDKNGFHPSMSGMQQLFNDGKMNIVQNVGYPDQNRSHFRSTDIWNSASAADEYVDTGWIGRYMSGEYPEYPDNYPNDVDTDPFAITLGYVVSETCQGNNSNFSMAINNPDDLKFLGEYEGSLYAGSCYGDELAFVRNEIKKTNEYADVVTTAYGKAENLSTNYSDVNSLDQQLKIVARLIAGGLQTKVYVVNLGGFDTHSEQIQYESPLTGIHANLLEHLSNAVSAFQEDVELLGIGDRVVGMTYSEFGRQIQANFSNGTDHGTAAPLFVFGNCVNGAILGDNPEIMDEVAPQAGVPMQFDFRSVYGSILMDWFEVPEDNVKSILFEDFQYMKILDPCVGVGTTAVIENLSELNIFPNPTRDLLSVSFDSLGGRHRISVFDVLGHEVLILKDSDIGYGPFENNANVSNLIPGQYFIRVIGAGIQKTSPFVKI